MSKLTDDSNAFHQSFVQAGDWFKELGRALNLTSSGSLAVSDSTDLRRPSFNRPLPRTGIISDKPQVRHAPDAATSPGWPACRVVGA